MRHRAKFTAATRWLLSLCFVLPYPASYADERFEVVKENYRGREYEVRVPKEPLDLAKAFPGEILLGTTKSHAYLYVDGLRVDGVFPPIPGIKTTNELSEGLVIRFPDLDKARVKEIRKALDGEFSLQGWSWSCVNTACSQLRTRAGIRPEKSGDAVFLTSLLDQLLSEQYVDKDGKPVRIELYKTDRNDVNLTDRMGHLRGADVMYTVMSTLLMGQLAYLGYKEMQYLDEKHDWRGRCGRAYRRLIRGRPTESADESDRGTPH